MGTPQSAAVSTIFSAIYPMPEATITGAVSPGPYCRATAFLALDVQGLGLFDVILAAQGTDVDVQIACPDKAAPFSKQIGDAVSQILARNDGVGVYPQLGEEHPPVPLQREEVVVDGPPGYADRGVPQNL